MNNDLKLRQLIANVFETTFNSINDDSSKDTLDNWDSVHHMNLIFAIEESFQVQFSDEEVIQLLSVKSIKIILQGKGIYF